MTSNGRPHARFRRALQVRSVLQAEAATRELPHVGLLDALDYLTLLAAEAPVPVTTGRRGSGWRGYSRSRRR